MLIVATAVMGPEFEAQITACAAADTLVSIRLTLRVEAVRSLTLYNIRMLPFLEE